VPVLIQITKEEFKPKVSFKFNLSCLEDVDFVNQVKKEWKHFDYSQRESTRNYSIHSNIKYIKRIMSIWAH
jgi:hypothetical protein